jgi:MoaA/NifB/PqqE/SkfB family radical SAM enzyme
MRPKCLAPWHSILVRFNGDIVPDGLYFNRYGNIFKQTLPEILNSSVAQATKESILSGALPPECIQCTRKETVTGHSRRIFFDHTIGPMLQGTNYTYTKDFHDIRMIEFNMSNICNLKCRMCNGISSSAWIKEEHKLAELSADYGRPVNHPEFGYRIVSDDVVDRLFAYPEYFKNFEYLCIKGGEPYMEPANKKILRKLIELNLAKNTVLDICTNGTIVDEEFHELAKQFKETKWTISIEGVGKLYNYIRGGENHPFEQLEENLQHFNQFDRVIFATTIMTYNVAHLGAVQKWYDGVKRDNYEIYHLNIVATPEYLNPSLLPQSILDLAKGRNNLDHINYTHNPELTHLQSTFVNFTKDLDKLRDTNVLNVCPELEELFR